VVFPAFYSILRSVTANITTGAALIVLFAAGWAILSHKVASRARWPLLGAALLLALWLGLIPGLLEWSRAPAWMVQGWERTARLPQGIAVLGRLWWLLCVGIDPGFWGVAALAASILVLCALPWLDRSPVLSIRYRPWWHRAVYGLFAGVFLLLGILGGLPSEPVGAALAQLGATLYFAFFLLMPWWSRKGPFCTVPQRLTGPSRLVAGKKEAQSP
jgi:quinol-cytochrome oxidoreductase complex cytochrome b subunit